MLEVLEEDELSLEVLEDELDELEELDEDELDEDELPSVLLVPEVP